MENRRKINPEERYPADVINSRSHSAVTLLVTFTSKQFKQSLVNSEGKEGVLFRVSGVFVNFLML